MWGFESGSWQSITGDGIKDCMQGAALKQNHLPGGSSQENGWRWWLGRQGPSCHLSCRRISYQSCGREKHSSGKLDLCERATEWSLRFFIWKMAAILRIKLNKLRAALGKGPGTQQTVIIPHGCPWDSMPAELREDSSFLSHVLLPLESFGTLIVLFLML